MSGDITQDGNLCVLVGESSKMFPCIHSFDWSDIQKDLTTFSVVMFEYSPKRMSAKTEFRMA